MQLQQLELKLFLADGETLEQERLIPIFHRWIQEDRLGQDVLLIDVADYTHVPDGPGVMIVADGMQWRMDELGGTGLLFARKRDPLGDATDKLREALDLTLRAAEALQAEPSLPAPLRFATDRLRFAVMSRFATSGDPDSFAELEPYLRQLGEQLYPGADLIIEQTNGPREALTAELRASTTASLRDLRSRL